MNHDDKPKEDIVAKRRRAGSIGGRVSKFMGAGYHLTPEQVQVAVQNSHMAQRLKREQQGKALPDDILRKWHWRAMAAAWKARPEGVNASSGWRGDYGNIPRKVWLLLRDYKDGAMIETYETPRERRAGIYTPPVYWLRLTPFGEYYYRDNWHRYHDLYPDVDAPAPTEPDQKTEETVSI